MQQTGKKMVKCIGVDWEKTHYFEGSAINRICPKCERKETHHEVIGMSVRNVNLKMDRALI